MGDVYSTGITGLNAAQAAINTIAQNVANANTPGYTRQTVQTTTQAPSRLGGGYIGNGVMVTGVNALVNPFLEAQLTSSTAAAAGSSQMSTYLSQLQGVLSDGANGVSKTQSAFQSALSQVASSASSIPARQLTLTTAKSLSDSLKSVAAQLQSQKQGAQQTLTSSVGAANTLLGQIAKLNGNIAKSEPRDATGNTLPGQQANDLRSQRQTLINQLAQYADVTTVDQSEGVSVFIGGASVVISNQSVNLVTRQNPMDASELSVGIATSSGVVNLDAASVGGKIGATMDFVEKGIDQALAQVNQYAGVMAQAVNEQSAKGVDLYGNAGGKVFAQLAPQINSSTKNTGDLNVSATVDAYASQPSDYSLTYTTAGGYSLRRMSDNTVVAGGATLPLKADGLTLGASGGAPQDGDAFLIRPFGAQAANMDALMTDPKQLALSSPVASSASSSNSSTAKITAPSVTSSLPLNPNLTSPVSIVFTSPTAYTISGPGIGTLTDQPYTSGADISHNGWTVKLSGAPAVGDSFSIQKSNGSAGDSANANALLSKLQGKTFGGGSQSLADLYANIQSDIGNKASLAQINAQSDTSVLNIAQNQRESYSGVNLDQEAADLSRWQQIYSANAQVMSVAQKLFENLMAQIG
jgi:flagellar hook-associated protein 1 FlgK